MQTPKKDQMVYALTAFLERDQGYSEQEINEFIKSNTDATLRSAPRFDVDHLRVAMVENGFLERESDGSQYRVAADFSYPWDGMQDGTQDPKEKVCCPLCGVMCGSTQFLNHIYKRHKFDDIIKRCLGIS